MILAALLCDKQKLSLTIKTSKFSNEHWDDSINPTETKEETDDDKDMYKKSNENMLSNVELPGMLCG
jgi:hypothetical protein